MKRKLRVEIEYESDIEWMDAANVQYSLERTFSGDKFKAVEHRSCLDCKRLHHFPRDPWESGNMELWCMASHWVFDTCSDEKADLIAYLETAMICPDYHIDVKEDDD
jgi:hypothetical protein